MNKEELEKEADEYVTRTNNNDFTIEAYLAGAEPREKQIAELEAQIDKMKCCHNCKNCAYAGFEIICRTYDCVNQSKWEIKEK